MRIESKKKIRAGRTIIGGASPLICLPLTAKTLAELKEQADRLVALEPDLIEWRLDYFTGTKDLRKVIQALALLRGIIGTTPLLFTCRCAQEGGTCHLPADQRLELNLAAISDGRIELLDAELYNGIDFIAPIKLKCDEAGVKLVLSYHNFNQTPEQDFLLDQLIKAQALGADIAKIAVMPQTPGDVLTLLQTAFVARTQFLEIPIIAISMGSMGAISRIAGGSFGSDITFAAGEKESAPGQIPIADLRLHWKLMSQ